MEVIITASQMITRTIYLIELPSGNTAAIESTATFGELAVFLGMLLLSSLLVVGLVKLWKH